MSARRLSEEVFAGRHGTGDDPHLFAIADAAQNRALPDAVNTGTSACLMEVGPESDLARNAPHLVALPSFEPEHES